MSRTIPFKPKLQFRCTQFIIVFVNDNVIKQFNINWTRSYTTEIITSNSTSMFSFRNG